MSGEPRLAAKPLRKPTAFTPHCVLNTPPFLAEFRLGLDQAEGSPATLHGSLLPSLVAIMVCLPHQTTRSATAPAPAVAGPVKRQFPCFADGR